VVTVNRRCSRSSQPPYNSCRWNRHSDDDWWRLYQRCITSCPSSAVV